MHIVKHAKMKNAITILHLGCVRVCVRVRLCLQAYSNAFLMVNWLLEPTLGTRYSIYKETLLEI